MSVPATRPENQIVQNEFSREQLELIKSNVAKGATDDELKLFLYRAKNLGLDPLKPGQIYFIKYGGSPGTIVVGIDGFRSTAAKTQKHRGTKRGLIVDSSGKCTGAWCEVYREGWDHPAREEAEMDEYNTGKGNWQKMPKTMIKKVAEAAALRMAFPDELGGVYAQEEMEQATVTRTVVDTAEPRAIEASVQSLAEYAITFGKHRGKRFREITDRDMKSYVDWANSQETLNPAVADLRDKMTAYLIETSEIPQGEQP